MRTLLRRIGRGVCPLVVCEAGVRAGVVLRGGMWWQRWVPRRFGVRGQLQPFRHCLRSLGFGSRRNLDIDVLLGLGWWMSEFLCVFTRGIKDGRVGGYSSQACFYARGGARECKLGHAQQSGDSSGFLVLVV